MAWSMKSAMVSRPNGVLSSDVFVRPSKIFGAYDCKTPYLTKHFAYVRYTHISDIQFMVPNDDLETLKNVGKTFVNFSSLSAQIEYLGV